MEKHFFPVDFPDKHFPFVVSTKPYSKLHSHSTEIEIHYITSGAGYYLIDNNLYDIREGSLLIIHRNELHHLDQVRRDDPLKKITLIFSPKIFTKYGEFSAFATERLCKCHPGFKHLLPLQGSTMVMVEQIMRSIRADYRKQEPLWRESIVTQLIRLCIVAYRYSQLPLTEEKQVSPGSAKTLQKVLSYIDRNISRDINLELIAEKAMLSPNYLSFKFKKFVGLTIKEYIISKRINEAKKILIEKPYDKIICVALEVGFKDLSHFNHTFKKLTGYTPSIYRKICQTNRI